MLFVPVYFAFINYETCGKKYHSDHKMLLSLIFVVFWVLSFVT